MTLGARAHARTGNLCSVEARNASKSLPPDESDPLVVLVGGESHIERIIARAQQRRSCSDRRS